MTWLRTLAAVVAIVAAIVDWLKKRGTISEVRADIMGIHLQGVLDEIDQAQTERDRVRTDLSAHPERVRDDDGFRRD